MSKRVYISADYSQDHGDRAVVEALNKWGSDNWHIVGSNGLKHLKGDSNHNKQGRLRGISESAVSR